MQTSLSKGGRKMSIDHNIKYRRVIYKEKKKRVNVKLISLAVFLIALLSFAVFFIYIRDKTTFQISGTGKAVFEAGNFVYNSIAKIIGFTVDETAEQEFEEVIEEEQTKQLEEEQQTIEEQTEEQPVGETRLPEEKTTEQETAEEEQAVIEEQPIEEETILPENITDEETIETIAPPVETTNITKSNITNENITEITNITIIENITEITIGNITEEQTNITIPEEITNKTIEEINETIINETFVNETITNITTENITAFNITTKQYKAVINRKVKWLKTLKVEKAEAGSLILEIPKQAVNITVRTGGEVQEALNEIEDYEKIIEQTDRKEIAEKSITGMASYDTEENKGILTSIINWLKKLTITGEVIQEQELQEEITEKQDKKEIDLTNIIEQTEEQDEIAVEYYTDAPQSFEQEISARKKQIIISAPDELNYTNILAYTELPTEASGEKIHLYHLADEIINGTEIISREEVNITKYDLNNNSLIDYIEWIVPHLSNQTYELEIVIINAEHLNKKREFIANIYTYVNETDNITYTIPKDEYVRAYFERNLTSERVIDIFVQNNNPATIEVYEKDSDVVIGKIENVISGLYIIELNFTGSNDIFDLKSVGDEITYDYIHDAMSVTDTTFTANETSIADGSYVLLSWQIRCAGAPAANVILWAEDDASQIASTCGANNFLWVSTTISTCEAAGGCTNNGDGTVTATTCSNNNVAGTFTIQGCSVGNANVLDMGTDYGGYTFDLNASVDVTGAPDTVYPTFNAFISVPTNASSYVFNQIYMFNSTVTNTNGTVGLEFNGVNYTARNLTSNVYNVTINNLAAGTYNYYWWGYGNGTNKNFNRTQDYSYTINKTVPFGSLTNTTSWTVTYPRQTNISYAESNLGDSDVKYNVSRDNVYKNGGENITLAAGTYVYVLNTTGGQNYTANASMDTKTLIVNKNTSTQTSLTFDKTSPQSYPNAVTPTCSLLVGQGTPVLKVNGTTITSGNPITLGGGTWTFNCSIADNGNYSSAENITTFQITQNTTYVLSLAITPSTTETYGTETTATGSGCPSELNCNLTLNTTGIVTNPHILTLGVGTYNYTYNTTGNANYSSNSASNILTINIATGIINGTINGTQGNFTAFNGSSTQNIYINATNKTGYGTGKIYVNGSLYNSGTLPLYNVTNLSIGFYNITFEYDGNENYTSAREVWWVNITVEVDTIYPSFSGYWDDNATLINSGTGKFNVTLLNTNGTVLLEINGQNITARNLSASVYNASYEFTTNGTYTYRWHSWGNGSSKNYNKSIDRSYTVNYTDTIYPSFSGYWDDNATLVNSGTGKFNVTLLNTNGTVLLEINNTNITAANLTASVYNVSYNFTSAGAYTYRWHSWGNGTAKNYNKSIDRSYTINATPDLIYPTFNNYWDNNASLVGSGIGLFNVTVTSTNGTVLLEINNTNITATNLTASVYNVSYNFTGNGTYTYRWHSWGNGTAKNYNVSVTRSYTINATPDLIYPTFNNYWDNNASLVGSGIGLFNVTVTSTNGTVLLEINGQNITARNLSSNVYNASYSFTTNGTYTYRWHSWGNGTANNYNKSTDRYYTVNYTDTIYPSWSNNKTDLTISTILGTNVYFNITLTEINPSAYIFSWYNGTNWENTTDSYTNNQEVSINKTINIDIGTINWTWYINDTANNLNQTNVWSVNLVADDALPPNVSINYPLNSSYSVSSINFNITALDNVGISSCKYTLNNWVANYTMTNTTSLSIYNHTNSSIADGSYTAKFWCNDTNNNVNNSEMVSFVLDTAYPSLMLLSPANNSGDNDGNVSFIFNVSDNNGIANCSLIINNVVNATNSSVVNGINTSFIVNGLAVGSYNWSINCSDTAGNVNNTAVWKIVVAKTSAEFSGETTDLSSVNISNITNLVLDSPNYGKINFSESVDLSTGGNIDSFVNISFNRIEVNISGLATLDKTARLTLYNLTYSNPRVLKDGAVCSDCVEIDYSSGTFIFDVTGFSVYSAEETPVAAMPSTASSGGGGGALAEIIEDFSFDPEELKVRIVLNDVKEREIKIKNTGENNITIKVRLEGEGMDKVILFKNNELSLGVGEEGIIKLNITARELEIYAGKIILSSPRKTKEVLVTINTQSKETLFDISLAIPENIVKKNEALKAQINLIPIGEKGVDITLKYLIKDYKGKAYYEESETFYVDEQKSFAKEFKTGKLEYGSYVLGIEMTYAGGFASTSVHFEVKEEEKPSTFIKAYYIYFIILIMLIIVILFVIFELKKMQKYKRYKK